MPENKTIKGKASKKHIHKYMHQTLKFHKVWRCGLSDCTHFMPPHLEEIILGRLSICWGCAKPFTMDERAMNEEMPVCIDCYVPELEEHIDEKTPEQIRMMEVLKRLE